MKTSLALAALLLAGAVSAPVFASDDANTFDSQWYVTQLKQDGVNAVAAYQGAPGEIRAVVQTAEGQVFQYFDDETLAPIGANNAVAAQPKTRVLTKLDVGNKAPVFPQYSLLEPDTDHDN